MTTSTTTHAFANLFRSSRLASYDRTINQVYTTTKNFKKIGDWGLKRNLPTVIRTDYTTIKDLDTAEHQTPWYTANNQVLFMKRWKENFDASVSQKPKTPAASVTEDNDKQLQNVMAMTPAQFNHFKKQCAKRASEFQHLVKSKQLVREQIYDYLNVTFEQERPVMGPTYSAATPPQEPLKVQGRILNPVKVDYFIGHAVAVGGIVALLPREYASFIQANKNDRNQLHDFYVESITMNEDGTPLIILNPLLHSPSTSIDFLLSSGTHTHTAANTTTNHTTTHTPTSSTPFTPTTTSLETSSLPEQPPSSNTAEPSHPSVMNDLFLTERSVDESKEKERQKARLIMNRLTELLNDKS